MMSVFVVTHSFSEKGGRVQCLVFSRTVVEIQGVEKCDVEFVNMHSQVRYVRVYNCPCMYYIYEKTKRMGYIIITLKKCTKEGPAASTLNAIQTCKSNSVQCYSSSSRKFCCSKCNFSQNSIVHFKVNFGNFLLKKLNCCNVEFMHDRFTVVQFYKQES